MKAADFNLADDEIKFWDLDQIERNGKLDYSWLKQDIAYVLFASNIAVDVGWYPEFKPTGRFIIMVVPNDDWDSPIGKVQCRSISRLKKSLNAIFEWCRTQGASNRATASARRNLASCLKKSGIR